MRKTLPPSEWPAVDKEEWDRALSNIDVFNPGPKTVWAPWQSNSLTWSYSRWLGFLENAGMLENVAHPADRATQRSVAAYIDYLSGCVKDSSRSTYVGFVLWAMVLMAPERDWSWFKEIRDSLRRKLPQQRKKFTEMSAGSLYELGITLMSRAESDDEPMTIKHAVFFRDGLMIALLASRPLRRANFTNLRLGRHLLRTRDQWTLHVSARETKANRQIEMPLPQALNEYMSRFVNAHRPMFPEANFHDFLWPSTHGGPLGYSGLYQVIVRRTKAAFGKAINPSAFRANAATTIAKVDPLNIHAASHVLGHARHGTTDRYYIQTNTLDASRRHIRHLDELRQRLQTE